MKNDQHGNETARAADTTPHGGETSLPEGPTWLRVWDHPTEEDPGLHIYELRGPHGLVKGSASSIPALLAELQGIVEDSPACPLSAQDAAAVVRVAQLAAHLGLTVDAFLALKRHEIVRRCHDAYEATVASEEASEGCTGIAAGWCPIHGACTCVDPEDKNDDDCPLHSAESDHAPWVDGP